MNTSALENATPERTVVRNYDSLIQALRDRQTELGLTVEKIDELSGLPSGYTGKLLGAAQMKAIGPLSLGLLLETLGLELVPRPNVEATKSMSPRWEKRVRPSHDAQRLSSRAKHRKFPAILFRVLGKRSVKARMDKTTEEQRSAIGRRAAIARWRAVRKARRSRRSQGKASG